MYLHIVPKSCTTLRPHGLYPVRILCSPLSPGVCLDSCPLTWCCCITISSSVTPFFFCLQSFPASGSFPTSGLFASDDQSIRASASASVLPMSIQGWFPLGLTGLIYSQSMGLSRVFSNTTILYKYVYIFYILFHYRLLQDSEHHFLQS